MMKELYKNTDTLVQSLQELPSEARNESATLTQESIEQLEEYQPLR